MEYYFNHIINCFVLKETGTTLSIVAEGEENKLRKQFPQAKLLPAEKTFAALLSLAQKNYYQAFYEKNIEQTKEDLRKSVNEDCLIIQAIANINELDRVVNILAKRLREWESWSYPELSEEIMDHKKYAQLVLEATAESRTNAGSMGADLSSFHLEEIKLLASEIINIYSLRHKHEAYLETVMKEYCPNIMELAGVTIGARLVELGRSLKHLALLPASTMQLLGAEKALFRHIKTGSRSPKFGVIHAHPLVQKAKREDKGKVARMLADKLSLCARLDYFKGEFKAPDYKKELEEKLVNMSSTTAKNKFLTKRNTDVVLTGEEHKSMVKQEYKQKPLPAAIKTFVLKAYPAKYSAPDKRLVVSKNEDNGSKESAYNKSSPNGGYEAFREKKKIGFSKSRGSRHQGKKKFYKR
ncbi:NOP58 family protein [Candidatus Woesearchaeota archaeon]|nr:NOP58 family protein [Candidatus Woesearchaeota archaeon]